MWNKSISLPVKRQGTVNKNGIMQDSVFEFIGGIPANFTDVTRNDETLASQLGYTADQNVEIMACNYNGQDFLIDDEDGSRYEIRRTHRKNKAMTIILTCELRERGKEEVQYGGN